MDLLFEHDWTTHAKSGQKKKTNYTFKSHVTCLLHSDDFLFVISFSLWKRLWLPLTIVGFLDIYGDNLVVYFVTREQEEEEVPESIFKQEYWRVRAFLQEQIGSYIYIVEED